MEMTYSRLRLCKIEARDGAHIDVTGTDDSAGGNLSYSFSVDMYEGRNGH
jgi:hypothetical protein